ncbi:MAG: PQQ-dependent sugar dehydrogenase [Gammaproteobacteria bacterium]|nr:PQQ-dependent sugar dehydrogenase [Gammaproteobacteria bacterium]
MPKGLVHHVVVRKALLLFLLTLLAACGGGGGGGGTSPAQPAAPAPVNINIDDANVTEGDSGQVNLTFTVTLSAAAGADVSVDYATSSGTATQGTDFVATNGTANFTAGMTSQPVSVPVIGDSDDEGNETLSIALSNVTGDATIADGTGTGTIVDDDGSPLVGLNQRPSNTTCVAPPRPTAGASVAIENPYPASPGFSSITKILQAPGDGSRWFVVERVGRVRVFNVADPGNPATYLDISGQVRSGGEEGLLGMAFHPDFPATPEIYLSYIAGTSSTRHSRISRFILDNTNAPVNVTEQILLTVDQFQGNHNGGDIAFGPDNYLYIGLGDGGGGGDPQETGQNTTNLLGSMLRIDVLGVAFPMPAYMIPPDNPFAAGNPNKCGPTLVNGNNCPEIYAWGLRNPWRWSFDEPTGMLWLGDVGQGAWEEVDIIERGGNYGWDCREGAHPFEGNGCPPPAALIDPVSEYPHTNGNVSITGGYVYRGNAIPGLFGRYVFADYASGRIWALQDDGQGGYSNELLVNAPYTISAFALGEDGELYFADFSNQLIRRLIPAGPGNPDTIPDNLVDTGCVDTNDPTQPAAGLVPYTINAPFWSDAAVKPRWMALPDGSTIDIDASDDFVFPNGSVLVKNFELGGQLIETRLLMRHPDGVWAGYTYEWNDTVTAATRVRGGKTRMVNGQEWIYPSEGECMQCHTSAAGFSLGPEIAQLNGDLTYPSTGITANQLDTLDHIMMFTNPLPGPASSLPALADPTNAGASLADRARAYLHSNCAGCHRPNGPTPSTMDWLYTTALSATNACDVTPSGFDLDIGPNARLIAPGNAGNSVIPGRMDRRDVHGMPPLGSNLVDSAGVGLINGWIGSLSNCN